MIFITTHLLEEVLPKLPLRQWVLSVPKWLRYHLTKDAALASQVLRIFIDEIEKQLKKAEYEGLGASSRDSFEYEYGKYPSIKDDYMILPDKEIVTKLACSHALAQSIKLAGFESIIQKTTHTTRDILKTLSTEGKISKSRKEIRHLMGKILLDRNSINLHLELLYTPKFFWRNSDLEPLYQMTTTYVDLQDRVDNLNHRLEVMHELFNMLAEELNYQHSASLEWIIIFLITFEVIITLCRDYFHWF